MIECDFCGKALSEVEFMTDCGHVVCKAACLDTGICSICREKCSLVLVKEEKQQIAHYETKFLTSVKAILGDTEHVLQLRFNALSSLVLFQKHKIARQKMILDQTKTQLKMTKEYIVEISRLQRENALLKKSLQQQKDVYSYDFPSYS